MKVLTIVLLTVLATAMAGKVHYDENKAGELFEKFIKDYNRHYKDDQDKQVHFEAFKRALKTINEANERNPLATYDINQFSDYTDEEMREIAGGVIPKKQP